MYTIVFDSYGFIYFYRFIEPFCCAIVPLALWSHFMMVQALQHCVSYKSKMNTNIYKNALYAIIVSWKFNDEIGESRQKSNQQSIQRNTKAKLCQWNATASEANTPNKLEKTNERKKKNKQLQFDVDERKQKSAAKGDVFSNNNRTKKKFESQKKRKKTNSERKAKQRREAKKDERNKKLPNEINVFAL